MSVLYLHAAELLNLSYKPPNASLAVDFFFLLSGFVLAIAYDRQLSDAPNRFTEFALRRLVRLYPMLFLGTALGVVVAALGTTTSSLSMLVGSFLLPPVGFISGVPATQAYPYNNPVWSLFFELGVNFLYCSRFGRAPTPILLGVVASAVLGLAVTTRLAGPGAFQLIGFASPGLFLAGTFRVSCSFWLGVALFRLGWITKIKPLPPSVASLILLVVLFAPVSYTLFSFVAVLLVFPILVLGCATARLSSNSIILCRKAGELSYLLYLLHQPVFRIVRNIPRVLHIALAPGSLLLVGTVSSVIMSYAALRLFDVPSRRFLTDVISRARR